MAGRLIDRERLRAFLRRLDAALDRPGVLLLLGGTSLTWRGVKEYSTDIDVALDENEPDPAGLLDAIDAAGDFVEATVDVIRMGGTLPLPEGYMDRAELAEQLSRLTVLHFDPYSIALAKLDRSAQKDVVDVAAMLQAGLIDCAMLYQHYEATASRFPRGVSRSDKEDFKRKVEAFYRQHCE